MLNNNYVFILIISLIAVPSWCVTNADNTIEIATPTGDVDEDRKRQLVYIIGGAIVESGYLVKDSRQSTQKTEEKIPIEPQEKLTEPSLIIVSNLTESDGKFTLIIELRSSGETAQSIKKASIDADQLFDTTKKMIFFVLNKEPPRDDSAQLIPAAATPAPPPLPPKPAPKPAPAPPTPQEVRASKAQYCATRRNAHLPAKVFGLGLILPVGLFAVSAPIFSIIYLSSQFSEIDYSHDDDDDYDSEKEMADKKKRLVMITGSIFMGVNTIVGSILTSDVGTDSCWRVSIFPMFAGYTVGSVGSMLALWGYMNGDKRGNKGLGFLTFAVVPIFLPAITETLAYLLFREKKFQRGKRRSPKRARKSYKYSPPSLTMMSSHDGRRKVVGLSFGQVSF